MAGHAYYGYYGFPVGSSILSVPFVALTRAVGVSTVRPDGAYDLRGDRGIQVVLASLLMAALAALFYATARLVLPAGWSLVAALVGALGTQVWSTAAVALWSDTWGIRHGGMSFGPRYTTGIVPWLFLLAVLGVRARVLATWEWNSRPPIETHADEKVWNWRAPQFLARPAPTPSGPPAATVRSRNASAIGCVS